MKGLGEDSKDSVSQSVVDQFILEQETGLEEMIRVYQLNGGDVDNLDEMGVEDNSLRIIGVQLDAAQAGSL